jgi:Domain of unknown function (DUF3883)
MPTCKHGSTAPSRILNRLHQGQEGPQRHKCTECAFEAGYSFGSHHSGAPIGNAECTYTRKRAPKDVIDGLPESQAGKGRHKCAVCAYHAGIQLVRGQTVVGQIGNEISEKISDEVEQEIERRAGFQPNSKIRKVIELHAMRRAENEMRRRGYDVKDVSAKKPYDLFCEKRGKRKYVEVKGTRSSGFPIALTAGEVKFINSNKSNCILCIVLGIKVRGSRNPQASGGKVQFREPFDLSDGKLCPIAFTFVEKK